jgi:hypothetical protein
MLPQGSPNFCTSKGSSYDPQTAGGGLQFHNQKNFKFGPLLSFFWGPDSHKLDEYTLACICVSQQNGR